MKSPEVLPYQLTYLEVAGLPLVAVIPERQPRISRLVGPRNYHNLSGKLEIHLRADVFVKLIQDPNAWDLYVQKIETWWAEVQGDPFVHRPPNFAIARIAAKERKPHGKR